MKLLDPFKLKILEKMSTYLKSPVQFKKIGADIWGLIGRMKVEYLRISNEPKAPQTQEEEQLEKFQKLQSKNKLTKKKHREMIELTKKIKKRHQNEKGEETDRRLRREVQKEMIEADATSQTKNQNNLKRQIILKVFYIIIRVIRSFVLEDGFDVILDVLLVFLPKADPEFCTDVLRELQAAYQSLESEDMDTPSDTPSAKGAQRSQMLLTKRMLIIGVITQISNENRELTRNKHRRRKHVHTDVLLLVFSGVPPGQVWTGP